MSSGYLGRSPDWSLLVVAAIVGGAAACALVSARLAGRAESTE